MPRASARQPHRHQPLPRWWTALITVGLGLVIVGALLAARDVLDSARAVVRQVASDQNNFTLKLTLPGPVEAFTQEPRLAYTAHALLGTVYNELNKSSRSAGIQWLKAAGHARSDADVRRAAGGISLARQRSLNPEEFEATLCTLTQQSGQDREHEALTLARVSCGPTIRVRSR